MSFIDFIDCKFVEQRTIEKKYSVETLICVWIPLRKLFSQKNILMDK